MLIKQRYRLLASLFVFFAVTVGAHAETAPRNGLVVEYLFEDLARPGLDTSGNQSHANAQGTPEVVQGKIGQALKVDELSDVLEGVPGFDKGQMTTFNLWFKTSKGGRLLQQSYWSSSQSLWQLLPPVSKESGNLVVWAFGYHSGRDDLDIRDTQRDFRDNQWHMLSIITDGHSAKVYVDGQFYGEDSSSAGPGSWVKNQAASMLQLGGACVYGHDNCSQGREFFDGLIDNYRMYNRALTDAEIAVLYNETFSAPDIPTSFSTVPEQGLAVEYLFEYASHPGLDSSGNQKHATVPATPTFATGKLGQAIKIDEFSDVLTDIPSFNKGQMTSINLWFKTSKGGRLMQQSYWKDKTGPVWEFLPTIRQSNGTLAVWAFGWEGGGRRDDFDIPSSNKDYRDNQWHMLTVITDGVSGKAYVDGQYYGEDKTSIGVGGANIMTKLGGACIYGHNNCYQGQEYFDGFIDNYRMYHRALTEAEIAQLYNETPVVVELDTDAPGNGLVVEYQFENAVYPGADTSGANNHARVTGTPELVQGKVGNALSIDELSDVLEDTPGFDKGQMTTFNLWFKTSVGGYLMQQSYWHEAYNHFWEMRPQVKSESGADSGSLSAWAIASNGAGRDDLELAKRDYNFKDNQWHMLTIITDGNAGKAYVDGKLFAEDSTSNGPASWSHAQVNRMTKLGGACIYRIKSVCYQAQNNQKYFNGLIDNYRMYNRALIEAEITQLYNEAVIWDLDKDKDGLPDRWELRHFGNTTTVNVTSDTDGDGISDVEEFKAGSDVLMAATPVVEDDALSVNKNTVTELTLFNNDSVKQPSLVLLGQPVNGSVAFDAGTSKITYTPNADYSGYDNFTYQIKVPAGLVSNTATVSLNVITGPAPTPIIAPSTPSGISYHMDTPSIQIEIRSAPDTDVEYYIRDLLAEKDGEIQTYNGPFELDYTARVVAWARGAGYSKSHIQVQDYIDCIDNPMNSCGSSYFPKAAINNLRVTPGTLNLGQSGSIRFDYENVLDCYAEPSDNPGLEKRKYYVDTSSEVQTGQANVPLVTSKVGSFEQTITCRSITQVTVKDKVTWSVTPSPAPQNIVLKRGRGLQDLILSWSPVVGATSYRLEYRSTAQPTWQRYGNSDGHQSPATLAGLSWDNYSFRVRACVESNCELNTPSVVVSAHVTDKGLIAQDDQAQTKTGLIKLIDILNNDKNTTSVPENQFTAAMAINLEQPSLGNVQRHGMQLLYTAPSLSACPTTCVDTFTYSLADEFGNRSNMGLVTVNVTAGAEQKHEPIATQFKWVSETKQELSEVLVGQTVQLLWEFENTTQCQNSQNQDIPLSGQVPLTYYATDTAKKLTWRCLDRNNGWHNMSSSPLMIKALSAPENLRQQN